MAEKESRWGCLAIGCCTLLGLLLVVVIGGFCWFLASVRPWEKPQAIRIPTPKMPSPNAFDIYVKAAGSIRDEEKIGYACSNEIGRAAPSDSSEPNRKYSLVEIEALVEENSAALKELRRGFAYEYRNPPTRSANDLSPYLSQFRTMARLLVLESRVEAAHGDWTGSVDICMDTMRLGADVPRGGVLLNRLVGGAIESIARRDAWRTVDRLNANEARAACRRMEDILRRRIPLSETMREEKWYGQATLVEIMSGKAVITHGEPSTRMRCPGWMERIALRKYTARMDECIAALRKPDCARPLASKERRRLFNPFTVIPDTLCDIMVPVYDKAWYSDAKNETLSDLLMVAMALRAYRVEHGAYPKSLSELAPAYLSKVPKDPFALRAPLRYKLVGNRPVLYSIGPDARDDGGRPIDAPNGLATSRAMSPAERRHAVQEDSKGDVVMGVNTF